MTRKGAPLHGTIGEGKTAISAASSQAPEKPWARDSSAEERKTETTPAISNEAVTADGNWRGKNN
jgi:hypothetical protein